MRGFRGNRAALNQFSSRFGRQDLSQAQFQAVAEENGNYYRSEAAKVQRQSLPNWLKTPETRAIEKAKPQLRLITGGKAAAETTTAKVVAKKAAGKTAVKKTKTAKKPAAKKKAAVRTKKAA
jgi:hypothetical protein